MANAIQVNGMSFRWGERCLFEDLTFSIEEGNKVALVARNGAGKSTLMNMIAGADSPDEGEVQLLKGASVGYLRQDPEMNPDHSIIEEIFSSPDELTQLVKSYEKALEANDGEHIQQVIEQMDKLNGWDFESRIKTVLTRLRITNYDQKIRELSGGKRKRVALASILIADPDILFLDEPTNHLDLDMVEWLEMYLSKSKKTVFMVTHDRYFLDRVCTVVLELDDYTIYPYKGNYSYFVEKRVERIENFNMEVEKARSALKTEQDWMNRMPQARATKAKYRIDAFYQLKAKAAQKKNDQEVSIQVQSARLGKKVLELKHISKSYDDLVLLKDFSYSFVRKEKIGIVGENGTGKSTFLNIITQSKLPDAGEIEIGETVTYGYFRQDGMDIPEDKKVIEVISDISERIPMGGGQVLSPTQFLNHFLFSPDMHHIAVGKLSGGERRRLYLMTVLMKNPNFLILDEPTNDLDIMTLNILEDYLSVFDGCVIIVSHDRYFMDQVVDHLFVFKGAGEIIDYMGNYTQYRKLQESIQKEDRKLSKSAASNDKTSATVTDQLVSKQRKLSFKEKKEMEALEADMESLNEEKTAIEQLLSEGNLSTEALIEQSNRIQVVINELEEKEMRWLELSEI